MMRAAGDAGTRRVGLETTLLVHGVPRGEGAALAKRLGEAVRRGGGEPAIVGVVSGRGVVGLSEAELRTLLGEADVPKLNTANLGVCMARGGHGATTVSATVELCAGAGVGVFATGALGGVHKGLAGQGAALDISSDLAALARWPVAVVTSGVKSLLDVEGTREALETLGVPVVGWRCDRFPAFYRRESGAGVDARFDDAAELGRFVRRELARTGRGVVVCNPVPREHEVSEGDWSKWLGEAEARAKAAGATGRALTPAVLGALHEVSGGATLRANLALAESNAEVGGVLAAAMAVR